MKYVLVPLGNPGKEYEYTRHNAGRVVSSLINIKNEDVFAPDTYMNESGKAVRDYLRYHNDLEIIVMYDDKDIPLGTFRIAYDRGDGGHNGLLSIIEALGRTDFVRIRIGIAPKETDGREIIAPHGEEVQKFVLAKMNEEEISALASLAPHVYDAITVIKTNGYKKAMEVYN